MVDFGFEQGLSDVETGGIAGYFEDFKIAKTPLEAKRCLLWMNTTSFHRPGIGAGGLEGCYHFFRCDDRWIVDHGVDLASPAPSAGDFFYAVQPVQGCLAYVISADIEGDLGQV